MTPSPVEPAACSHAHPESQAWPCVMLQAGSVCKEYVALVVGAVPQGLHLVERPLLHDGKARARAHRASSWFPCVVTCACVFDRSQKTQGERE